MMNNTIENWSHVDFISYASGIGAGDPNTKQGPPAFFSFLNSQNVQVYPQMLDLQKPLQEEDKLNCLYQNLNVLSKAVKDSLKNKRFFTVIGGDHSIGIGTWSAVATYLQEPFSLLWVDAHLDAHTFATSPSQNVHGMPIAHLLGYQKPHMTSFQQKTPTLFPQNLYIVGARSYEEEEFQLLASRGVTIYFMEEVIRRGIDVVLKEVQKIAMKRTNKMGISIDIDAFDPIQMPGTGLQVSNGICIDSFLDGLKHIQTQKMMGLEIAEYNPYRDVSFQTAHYIKAIINHFIKTQ